MPAARVVAMTIVDKSKVCRALVEGTHTIIGVTPLPNDRLGELQHSLTQSR